MIRVPFAYIIHFFGVLNLASSTMNSVDFSEYHCTAGSQWLKWKATRAANAFNFPDSTDMNIRICHFTNVCWVNKTLVYYLDPYLVENTPDYLHPTAFGSSLLSLSGHTSGVLGWSPMYILGRRPDHLKFDALINVHLLGKPSYDGNPGHLMIDTVFPGLIAKEMFGFERELGRLIVLGSCDGEELVWWKTNTTVGNICHLNYQNIGRQFYDAAELWLENTEDVCFRNVIAGQQSAFSLKSLELGRATYGRHIRNLIRDRFGLNNTQLLRHKILVVLKSYGPKESSRWDTLCHDVGDLIAHNFTSVDYECINPAEISFEEQVRKAWSANIIVAIHGTNSYIALFTRDNTVLVSIGNDDGVKEGHILLFLTHFTTLYMSINRKSDLLGMIFYAIHKSSLHFHLPTLSGNSTRHTSSPKIVNLKVHLQDDTLLRCANSKVVWVVKGNKRFSFSSSSKFLALGYRWENIRVTWECSDFLMLEEGGTL